VINELLLKEEMKDIAEKYKEASRLKDVARKSDENIEYFLSAADKYKDAYTSYEEYIAKNQIDDNNLTLIKALCEYYKYEECECRYAWNFKNKNYSEALQLADFAEECISNAASFISYDFTFKSQEGKDLVAENLKCINYTKHGVFRLKLEPIARQAMIEDRYVDAFDAYNEMLSKQEERVKLNDKLDIGPIHKRIALGNYYGMAINASLAMIRITLGHTIDDNLSAKTLLKHIIRAYEQSVAAYEANPEWKLYLSGQNVLLSNLDIFLSNNKTKWQDYLISSPENKILEERMAALDKKKYIELKTQLELQQNSVKRLYLTGGFWLFLFFGVIFGIKLIVDMKLPVYSLIPILFFAMALFVIISCVILRNMEMLSEQRFADIVKLSLRLGFQGMKALSKDKN